MPNTTRDIYYAVAHRSQAEIDSFKTRYDDFDESRIPAIFKQALGLGVDGWKRSSSWGSSHVIYFVDIAGRDSQLVLRANLGFNKQPEVNMKIEQLVTDQVLAAGIPTNKVLYVDISRQHHPFDFQIEERLVGDDLEDHFSGTQADYDAMSYQLGRYIAQYQTLTFPKFGLFDGAAAEQGKLVGTKDSFFEYITVRLDSDIAYLVDAKVFTKDIAKRVRTLFDERKAIINIAEGSLVHHDLADHNLMTKNNKLTAIFDWETAIVGDPVLDLASCPTWKTHYPREAQLIAGYRSVRPLPEHFQDKMDIYRLRTILWKMVFNVRANILTEERKSRIWTALQPFGIKNPNHA